MRSRGRIWNVIALFSLLSGLLVWPVLADSPTPAGLESETPQPAADSVRAVDSEATLELQFAEPPPRPIVVKLDGTIMARPPTLLGEWQVDDNMISVTIDTVVQPVGYDPQVGDHVLVKALRTPTSSSLIALRMTVEKQGEDLRPVEFRGIISQCVETVPYWGNWVVASTTVSVTGQTVIAGGAPRPGLYAHVRGMASGNGTVAAAYVEVLNPTSAAVRFQFRGLVQRMTPGVGLWIIGGVPGWVHTRTEFSGRDKIQLYSLVEVIGEHSGLLIRFSRIELIEEPKQVIWEGVIQRTALESVGEWVVGDKSVIVDEMTFIDESYGPTQPGMWAQVTATTIEGVYRAQRIRIDQP